MTKKTGTCAGCSRVHEWSYQCPLQEIIISPGVTAMVCPGRGRHQPPSAACSLKARTKAERCPGCGAARTRVGTICLDCKLAMQRAASLPEATASRHWYALTRTLVAPYLGDDEEPYDFVRCLAQALAGPGSKWSKTHPEGASVLALGNGGDTGWLGEPCVELGDAQVEAVKELAKKFHALARKEWAEGHAKGRNLLQELAAGKTSVADFDKSVASIEKWAKEGRG